LGEEARLDERGLFHHSVQFIQDRFFGRVIIQDKSEEGMETAKRFVSPIVSKVKGPKKVLLVEPLSKVRGGFDGFSPENFLLVPSIY
jgi:glutamine phosphoribosylpyrophosphate amidotransferase